MDKDIARAELLGALLGDGCLSKTKTQSKYFIYFCGNKLKDHAYFSSYIPFLFKAVFGKTVYSKVRKHENTIFIKFSDKSLFYHLNSLGLPIGKKYESMTVPSIVQITDDAFFAFVRGLFDTDGCVVLSKQHRLIPYYPRIEISSKSKAFLQSILSILEQHSFSGSLSNKCKGQYRLELPGFSNLQLWQTLIGSSNNRNQQKLLNASKSYLNACKPRPRIHAPIAQPVERASD